MTIGDKLSFKLMIAISELIKDSGASRVEAIAALQAAEAMAGEMELPERPTFEVQTRRRELS